MVMFLKSRVTGIFWSHWEWSRSVCIYDDDDDDCLYSVYIVCQALEFLQQLYGKYYYYLHFADKETCTSDLYKVTWGRRGILIYAVWS